MPQLYKILSNPSKFPKDYQALKAFLKVKGFQKGGDGFPDGGYSSICFGFVQLDE